MFSQAGALRKLKDRNVSVTWISAFAMPEDVREAVEGLFTAKVCGNSILDAVKATFGVNVSDLAALNGSAKRQTAAVRDFNALIDAAQFTYRNYQDETLFARAVSYVAKGIVSEAWAPEVRAAVAHYDRYGGRELIGRSEPIQRLQDRINRVAKHDTARVLILGESGTGKETVAIQIHNKSPRATGPFVAFNCASIASELLEDRFFGHEKGAFTGATERTDGLFALADGGTLFLDEIDGLVQDRTGASRSWEVTQVNELLHQMENFKGVMVGATNFMSNLDAAILRRFTFKLQFDYLTDEGKRLFFERMFGSRLDDAEADRLARIPYLAPGDFRTVRQSLYYLADETTNSMRLDGLERESGLKKSAPKKVGF